MANEKKCVDCNADFFMDDNEIAWFEERNMTLPKRCKDCRAKRKAEKESQY